MSEDTLLQIRPATGTAWLLVLVSGCGGGLFAGDVQTGLRRAQREKKFLLVEYMRLDCPHTARMHREAFPDSGVRFQLKDFVLVRRSVRLNQAEARQLGVTVTPTFLVYRSDGTIVTRQDGALSADAFRRFLIRSRIKW